MKNRKFILFTFLSIMLADSCTKLNETVGGNLTPGQVANDSLSATVLLQGVYASLEFTFTSFQQIFALADITTDEAIVPTRGNNWDDNGQWRVLHQHKWDPNNAVIYNCFKSLGGVVYAATDMLQYNPSLQQQAEARFLRAWAMYWLLDLFDQIPYREPRDSLTQPSKVRKGDSALDYIISEVNAVEPALPDGPVDKANRYAAQVLLMKCYLNKGVYENRAKPMFDPDDMNRVISLADSIIKSNKFSFSANYFDNFSPDNGSIGKENIFTQASNPDGNYALTLSWLAVLNYVQYYQYTGQICFNGFTTLPEFYNKFESTDKRRGAVYAYPNSPPNPGHRINLGFLIDQQYDLSTDSPLTSFSGLPVIYTPEVQNIELGPNLEMPGIRPVKYAPDFLNFFVFATPTNNFVYFRFPDVLLMKAEAIWRGGTATGAGPYGSSALAIVNAIRTDPSRGATPLSSLTPDNLLDERGRELWWENWRRQDMIRFERFLEPFQEKEDPSDPKYLLFPIPYEQLAVNPYLEQNPGY